MKLIWKFISTANKYDDDQAPWKLKNENKNRMDDVLWILADNIRKIAILTQPFIPYASKKILDQFNISTIIHGHTHRPFIHNAISNEDNYRRIVLGDWYEQGSVLEWSESGPKLIKLNRNH